MSEIKIHCSYSELVEIEKLKPNPRNPNQHPQNQIDLLAKIISQTGFRNPIVVSKRSGLIVKGHGRLEAAKKLNLKKVPVDFQEYDSESQEISDLLADNRIAELAEMDLPKVKDLLQELDTGEFDMDLTGYDQMELERLMTQFNPNSLENDDLNIPEKGDIFCPHCGGKI